MYVVKSAHVTRITGLMVALSRGMALRSACFDGSLTSQCFSKGFQAQNTRALEQGQSVLVYASIADYTGRQDRYWYDFIEGFLQILQRGDERLARFDVWGYGFAGWDKKLSPAANILNRLECCPDLIAIGVRIRDQSEPKFEQEHLVPAKCQGQTQLMQFGSDCHHGHEACLSMLVGDKSVRNSSIVALRHPMQAFEVLYPPPSNKLVTHIPFCVELCKELTPQCHGVTKKYRRQR